MFRMMICREGDVGVCWMMACWTCLFRWIVEVDWDCSICYRWYNLG